MSIEVTEMEVIRVAVGPTGTLFAAASDGAQNLVGAIAGDSLKRIASWAGVPIRGICCCGNEVVIVDDAQIVHVFGNSHRTLGPLGKEPAFAVESIAQDSVLVVGDTGKMWFVDIASEQMLSEGLSAYGVRKPGRTIANVINAAGRVFLLGRNRLLVELRGNHGVELLSPAKLSEPSLNLFYAAVNDGNLYISARLGAVKSVVGVVRENDVIDLDCPVDDYAPPIQIIDGQLHVLTNGICTQEHGKKKWECKDALPSPDSYIYLSRRKNGMIAVTRFGRVNENISGVWRTIGALW